MKSDYSDLEALADLKWQENCSFRSFLKFDETLSDKELDRLVFKTADEVASKIDCTQCGRCCNRLAPLVSEDDQLRLAKRLQITVQQLQNEYLEYEEDDEAGWIVKGEPCVFLKDTQCSIYEDRPDNCREYPYLDSVDFNQRAMGMIQRTQTCPIVFNVMESLKEEYRFKEQRVNDGSWDDEGCDDDFSEDDIDLLNLKNILEQAKPLEEIRPMSKKRNAKKGKRKY